jgi:hypothetical protein
MGLRKTGDRDHDDRIGDEADLDDFLLLQNPLAIYSPS